MILDKPHRNRRALRFSLPHAPPTSRVALRTRNRVTKWKVVRAGRVAFKVTHRTHRSPSGVTESLSRKSRELRDALRDGELGRADLLDGVGLANETRNVHRYFHPLLDAGLIAIAQLQISRGGDTNDTD